VKNEIGRRSTTFLLIGILVPSTFVLAQQSRWASRDDPVAKKMIQDEKDWAEGGCTQTSVGETFLADDFQGTAPSGERYNKSGALKRDAWLKERDCHLDDAKVRFFGESMAVIYGSERERYRDLSPVIQFEATCIFRANPRCSIHSIQ